MTTIYLIRHGQASIGSSNYDVLSTLGQEQSRVLGRYFEKAQLRFDRVFTGTLSRQIDTAAIALPDLAADQVRNPGFNEYQHSKIFDYYAGNLASENDAVRTTLGHGHNSKLTYQAFSALMHAWVDDNTVRGELESWDQFNHRIRMALAAILDECGEADTVAVFTSGGVICTILQMIAHFPVKKIFEINWGIYNASITTLKIQQSTPRLSSYNNITHLELENNNGLITNI